METENIDIGDDDSDLLLDTFILEFEELMQIYKEALIEIRRISGNKIKAYNDIFRVYHTLKGDSGYFQEFSEFTKFATNFCEELRNIDEEKLKDQLLFNQIRLNYSKLSSALYALNKGHSLKSFRFKIF